MDRSRILQAGYGLAQTVLEKVYGRIAVSEAARKTVVEHVGGDAVLIPNGIDVDFFSPKQSSTKKSGKQVLFLGRFDEERKGFALLADAFNQLGGTFSELTLQVAGPGDEAKALDLIDIRLQDRVHFYGRVSDTDKAELLRSADVYVAPNTGGESFGIVLLEAMASQTAVVASNIQAFERVLDFGKAGALFQNEDSNDLARVLRDTLENADLRLVRVSYAKEYVRRYDWKYVAQKIIAVYETVTFNQMPVVENLRGQVMGRFPGRSQS
jgi:phosphatidylinositol alpha-mannosyltransferase